MNLLGLEPIIAAAVITVLGVVIHVGLGVLQSTNPFDGKKLLASGIISVFTAFTIVIPIVSNVPEDADSLTQFAVFIGTIATVAGIDQLVKNSGNAIIAKIRNNPKE